MNKSKSVIACVWKEDEDGNWHTSCDEIFVLIDATPDENKMAFCCYCGRQLKQKRFGITEIPTPKRARGRGKK